MNAMIVLLGGLAILVIGYVLYGGWLAKQWGVDPSRPTPAQEMHDGVDYVPTKPYILLGHHFSSIAGAGPINGPIQAAVFGWVPVLLWVLIGGIFFGAVHDFGALFASLRHKGQTIATVIAENIDDTAKKLFCIFAYLTLVLVVAAFASIVANTFAVNLANATEASNLANQRTAMISVLFIVVAIVYGLATRGREIPTVANIIIAIAIIVVLVAVGYNFPLISLDYTTWMILLGVYIMVAAVAPVWILLQPRDFLSSFLLYGMIALSLIGIVGASITGDAANLQIPAFTDFYATNAAVDANGNAIIDPATGKAVINKAAASGFLFPALFITIACGAISGFHSLVASGTTSKQLDNEKNARPIAYGGMLLENIEGIAYTLLILAVSAFCLTSLDTATRLGRYMFQELWVPAGKSMDEATGARKVLTNPYVATLVTVILGVGLGMTRYTIIWPLFGAANQLLAALALLAVCAWLGNAGRNNKMFYIPMVFMLVVTLTSLVMTLQAKCTALMAGAGDPFAAGVQAALAAVLFVLAVILAVKGAKTIFGKKKAAAE